MSPGTMNILFFVAGVEIFFLMFCLCLVLLLKGSRRKKHDKKITDELVQKIKKDDGSRREKLIEVFSECYDMEVDDIKAVVDECVKREHAFYKTMISVYVNHDTDEFVKLTSFLEEVVKPYPDLALSVEQTKGDELEKVLTTNKVLEEENSGTKKVLGELMSEYSRSYDKENDGVIPEAIKGTTLENELVEGLDEAQVEGDNVDLGDSDVDLDLAVDSDVESTSDEVDLIAEEEIVEASDEDLDLLVEDLPEVTTAEEPTADVPDDDLDLIVEEDLPETPIAEETPVEATEDDLDLLVDDLLETTVEEEMPVDVAEDELDLLVEDLLETTVEEDASADVVETSEDDLDLIVEDLPEAPAVEEVQSKAVDVSADELDLLIESLPETPVVEDAETDLIIEELVDTSLVEEVANESQATDELDFIVDEESLTPDSKEVPVESEPDELDLFIEEIEEAQVVNKAAEPEKEKSVALDSDIIAEPVVEPANIDLDLILDEKLESDNDLEAILGTVDEELGVDDLMPDDEDDLNDELEVLLK